MASSNGFKPAVIIETLVVGRLRAVSSVRVAADMLLGEWPADKRTGAAYRDATKAVLAAMGGTGTVAQARKAFVAAAKAADIFVRGEREAGSDEMKRPAAHTYETRYGRRPKVGDRVEILVSEKPFKRGDRGIVEGVGNLVVTIRLERDPTRLRTLFGPNLKGRLLILG